MGTRFDPQFGTDNDRRKGTDNLAWDYMPTSAAKQNANEGWMNTDKPVGSQGQTVPECGNYPLSGMAGTDSDDIAATHPAYETMS